jgi:hypothetical protein
VTTAAVSRELEASIAPTAVRPRRTSTWATFRALLLRDLTVVDKGLGDFLANTIIQPLMLAFVFTYVFPSIGQAVGGTEGAAKFSTLLVGGMVAQSVVFQGLFRVALPMGRELDITNELEDRVMAPSSITTIALEKIVAGALQGLFAGLALTPIPWLKVLVLGNPLVYMSEGFRAALTVGVPHMPLVAVYGVLVAATVVLTVVGTRGFRARVLS